MLSANIDLSLTKLFVDCGTWDFHCQIILAQNDFLNYIPRQRIQQFHLAGHSNCGDYIIDTHDHPIIDLVWDLYAAATKRFPNISTMIERDDNIPTFLELSNELGYAKAIATTKIEMEMDAM